jgi:SAM-dependent methyltransferase
VSPTDLCDRGGKQNVKCLLSQYAYKKMMNVIPCENSNRSYSVGFLDTMSLTEPSYWERKQNIEWEIFGRRFDNIEYLFPIIDKYIRGNGGGDVFEFGFVPGQGLLKFCQRYGLIPHGADFRGVETRIAGSLIRRVFPTARFYECDLEKDDLSFLEKYDVVLSSGFLEHFSDIDSMLQKHVSILRPNGLLILNTPNLSPLRAFLWRAFDPKLLAAHNPRATNKNRVAGCLRRHGCEVMEYGFFGRPHFWIENLRTRTVGAYVIQSLNQFVSQFDIRNVVTMPYVYWIARLRP